MFLRVFERLFVVILFLSSMGVVDALTRPPVEISDVTSTEVPLSTAVIESALYIFGTLLVLTRWRRVYRAAVLVWPLVFLVALAPASILWSNLPLLTARRSVFLLGSTLLGIYLGERFSIEQLARLLADSFCVMITAVIVLYLVAPAYVIDSVSSVGAWKGLSVTKNSFGGYMTIAVLLLLLVRFRKFCWMRYVFLSTAALFVILSHSATSVVMCVVMAAAFPLWRVIRLSNRRRALAYPIVAIALLVGVSLCLGSTELLFRIVGRDSTLSGRTQLWSVVLSAIAKHPLIGYGYGSFWAGSNGETLNIWIGQKWMAMAADNGYLDLCLGFGVLGLAAFLHVLAIAFRMSLKYLRSNETSIGLWPITYLLFFGLHNIFESHLLTTRSLEFLLFAAITTSLSLHQRRMVVHDRPSQRFAPALANQ